MIDPDADIQLISDGGKERPLEVASLKVALPEVSPPSQALEVSSSLTDSGKSKNTSEIVSKEIISEEIVSDTVSTDRKKADLLPVRPLQSVLAPEIVDVRKWVTDHWDAVFKLMFRISGSRHEAEELTQESFLRAIERQASFTPGTFLRAWLFRIATNVFLDGKRREKLLRFSSLPDDMNFGNKMVTHVGPDSGMMNQERYAKLEQAISELPEIQRIVFVLRGQSELSFREIAEIISVAEETARWHMMHARRTLISKLDGVL